MLERTLSTIQNLSYNLEPSKNSGELRFSHGTLPSFVYKYYFINSNHFAYNINFLDRLRKKNIFEARTTKRRTHIIHLNEKKVALIYRERNIKCGKQEQGLLFETHEVSSSTLIQKKGINKI